ncbi:MAG: hypothetical protein IPH04_14455 [Saprospirales bacterium]|nr:hypothetical protein [Saprospirales bacterium]
MKSNKVWWVVVALVAVCGILLYLLGNARKNASGQRSELVSLADQLTVSRNEAGVWMTQAEGTKKAYDEVYAELLDAKAALVKKGVDVKNLRTLVRAGLQISDTLFVPGTTSTVTEFVDVETIVHDTTVVGFDFEDEWAHIKAVQDMFWYRVEYEVRDSVSFVIKEKHNLFKGTTLSLTGVSSNPNTRIEGLSLLELKPKNKRFGVGPQAGVGFDGKGFAPYLGVGVSYDLIRF